MTALQSAVARVWRDEVDPDRELELIPVAEGFIQHESRIIIYLSDTDARSRYLAEHLGYQHFWCGKTLQCRDWLHHVARVMRQRIASRPWEQEEVAA